MMSLNHVFTTARFQMRSFFTTCWGFGPRLQTGLWVNLKRFSRFLKACLFRKYRKKALLIGINGQGAKDLLVLDGPHRDVRALQQLIIDQYGYKNEDVVVMLDGGVVEDSLAPTRTNILREIRNLVKGAQAGDHFLFHFSGHSQQILNETGTEEDGWDEALITEGGETLIDNKLRLYLVDPLPVDCSLVAIFDTCHSASLLDLPHYRCNRVYVPWVSKESSILLSRYQQLSSRQPSSKQQSSRQQSRQQSSIDSVLLTDRSLSVYTQEKPVLTSIMTECIQMSPIQEVARLEAETGIEASSIILSPIMRCHSPQAVIQCDGFALCGNPDTNLAHVIALGACKDMQVAWEDNGDSLTAMLIDILKKDPHPRLKNMMRDINYRTYNAVCRLHDFWETWKEDLHRKERCHWSEDEENRYRMMEKEISAKDFQDPQLASHRKLDMNSFFTL